MEQPHNPFRVGTRLRGISQGSSFLATLGFGSESLWDSSSRFFKRLKGFCCCLFSVLFFLPLQLEFWLRIARGMFHHVLTSMETTKAEVTAPECEVAHVGQLSSEQWRSGI